MEFASFSSRVERSARCSSYFAVAFPIGWHGLHFKLSCNTTRIGAAFLQLESQDVPGASSWRAGAGVVILEPESGMRCLNAWDLLIVCWLGRAYVHLGETRS